MPRLTHLTTRCYRKAILKPYGKVNLVTLLLLSAVIGGIYSVWMFSKPVLDNLDVKEALSAALNQKGLSDDQLKAVIISRLERVGTHFGEDDFGRVVEKTGLGLTPDQITVDRDTVQGTLYLRIDYHRDIQLKPSGKWVQLRFKPDASGKIP
jgi:hypothetical protein